MGNLKIGVLMGGRSIEREVSLSSGRTICDHLDTELYDPIPIFQTHINTLFLLPWSFLYRGKIADFEHRLSFEAQEIAWDDLKTHIDIMYIAQHGRFAEDGTLQGALDILQIPYVGSKVFASALGMNKCVQKKFLQDAHIVVPDWISIKPYQLLEQTEDEIITFICMHVEGPWIVKPFQEGSSLGTHHISDKNDLYQAVVQAGSIDPLRHQEVIIEKKILGVEFSCIVITDQMGEFKALSPTEMVVPSQIGFQNYEQKYMPGRSLQFTPARLESNAIADIQHTCVRVAQVLEFSNYARIDGFFSDEGEVIIIDPNSFSGAAPSSFLFKQAALEGRNHSEIINYFIATEVKSTSMIVRNEKNESHQKMRIAVLMGGKSNEREISLESGRNITYKLSPAKYQSLPLFVDKDFKLYRMTNRMLVANTIDEVSSLCTESLAVRWHDLPKLADFVFIGLHGGEGENGALQGMLETLELAYNGSSVLASALCMRKEKTTQFLKHRSFDVPHELLIPINQWERDGDAFVTQIEQEISYPCVVKPNDDGCSVSVFKVHNREELYEAIKKVFAHTKKELLVQEYVQGIELTVGVIGNEYPQVLPASAVVRNSDILTIEEKFLPGAGENQTPAPLEADATALVAQTVQAVYKEIGCIGYARIDCFYQSAAQSPTGSSRVIILEVNTLPGMTPSTCIFHQAAEIGLKPMEFIDRIIQLGLEYHKPQRLIRHISKQTVEQMQV